MLKIIEERFLLDVSKVVNKNDALTVHLQLPPISCIPCIHQIYHDGFSECQLTHLPGHGHKHVTQMKIQLSRKVIKGIALKMELT